MRGECRIDRVAALQHAPRDGEPAHIGRGLSGEHRIVRVALNLRQLDLAIPVGTLHQPRRDTVPRVPAQCSNPIDQRQRAPLISLHGKAKPIPTGKSCVGQHGSEDVEADLQPVGLLRVDRKADVRILRRQREPGQRADQSRHAAPRLQRLIARMQCGQFHRDTRPLDRSVSRRAATDGADRMEIGEPVAFRIGLRLRGLAQHVEAVPQAPVGAYQRLLDRASHHELPREHPHAAAQRRTDHRLTEPADHPPDRTLNAARSIVQRQDAASQHERPGRGIHRDAVGLSEMALPVGGSDAIVDQRVSSRGIRNAQQRLGQAEQCHTFRSAETVLGQEIGDIDTGPMRGTSGAHQRVGAGIDAGTDLRRQCRGFQQRRQNVRLRRAVQTANAGSVVLHGSAKSPRWRSDDSIVIASEAKQSPASKGLRCVCFLASPFPMTG